MLSRSMHPPRMVTIPAPMQAPEALRNPFTDPEWLYELKFDGYRCMAGVQDGEVELRTKSGAECTSWYPEVVEALSKVRGTHVIDGEACVPREDGTSDFNLLQERARRRKWYPGAPRVTYCAFDILVHNGRKVIDLPLVARKALLEKLLGQVGGVLVVKDLPADAAVFQAVTLPEPEGLGLRIEGVMAKRKDSRYLPGVRSADWLKIKRPGWQEGRRWRDERGNKA